MGEQQRETMKLQASTLIAQTKADMNTYNSILTQQQKQILNEAIASLEKALENGKVDLDNITPEEGQGIGTEIPIFDPAVVQEAMDHLNQLYKYIFEPIKNDTDGIGAEPSTPGTDVGAEPSTPDKPEIT